ncbi:MAG: citrate synthase, partial [Lachnospiraceae bacterium]|nr:citrate synthase [Lachnospiraceae bacterium]
MGKCKKHDTVKEELYEQYGVLRGLRDKNGKGVLVGITHVSDIRAKNIIDGKVYPIEGQLFYRGYNVYELERKFIEQNSFGFEECAYLLIFGELPTPKALNEFKKILMANMRLPRNFVRDVIMKAPSRDIMNSLTKSVLTLASYDKAANDTSMPNVIRQCLQLVAEFPMLSVYGYHAYRHYMCDDSLYIHRPDKNLSMAENILRMLRPNKKYTELEAKTLDRALIL